MSTMTLIDILLGLPLLYFIFMGWKKGLVREVATLAGVLVGVWASVHLSQHVVPLLGLEGESAVLVAFIVTFIAALVLTWLAGRLVESLMKAAKLSLLNHVSGALIGAAKALCILAVLLSTLVMIDKDEAVLKPETKAKSVLYKPVYEAGSLLTAELKTFIEEHRDELKEVTR